ncbi:MAG: molybdopterin-dependent oxidoreductase [Spirochaetota bacterium]|jgi:CO/xanthine dehydrogenase Mo-binding subunit/aerobic-type carbon monoxide dehydrogenase small subunit (CoxS/CutS family)|nr:molybdopterin-dependent oxidoreductase [Spirochaetota bacterium]
MQFFLNGNEVSCDTNPERSLLQYLREDKHITSVKDGCSAQAACGACMVEVDGKPRLACVTRMSSLENAHITTIDGWPENVRQILGRAFVDAGAVQCGFCTPGMLTRTKILLENNPSPTRQEIIAALKQNVCRCTGYVKIIEAIELAARALRAGRGIELYAPGKVGTRQPKYDAWYKAIGQSPFTNDLTLPDMLFGALRMSDYPRARVLSISTEKAAGMPGVERILTAADVPGQRKIGLIENDWPLFIAAGEITHSISDVLACVVAASEEQARAAAATIEIAYEELPVVSDMEIAARGGIQVHDDRPNLAKECFLKRGCNPDADAILAASAHVARGVFTTQRVEHAFLEPECAIAEPWVMDADVRTAARRNALTPEGASRAQDAGVKIYTQSQGPYEDRRQLALLLGLPESRINVVLLASGGGFGGKEDLTVQGFAALAAYLIRRPVKVRLTRTESITMHPKRHPFIMEYAVGCDRHGKLTAVKARLQADTGSYLSVGCKVIERAVSHAAGAYFVPCMDVEGRAWYTNNIPSGAMRGFGVNQVVFAMESCIAELCEKGGFDRWQFRYDNALVEGSLFASGQILHNVAVRETLQSLKDDFYRHRYTGIACSIKNCGVGNGMKDECEIKVEIAAPDHIVLHHGWSEMGQGVDTVAVQMLCDKTGIQPEYVTVRVETRFEARAGMTTSSRGTSLLGNAVLNAVAKILADMDTGKTIADLVGKTYPGYWCCDWSTEIGSSDPRENAASMPRAGSTPPCSDPPCIHYSYSYAAQLVILNEESGRIERIVAAHDAGRIVNPTLFEGQVQGSVHMGIGYALSEDLPMKDGRLVHTRFRELGLVPIADVPEIVVKAVEVHDPHGPYGAKGIGEIGLVATAAAIADAYAQYDGERRYTLPLKPVQKQER